MGPRSALVIKITAVEGLVVSKVRRMQIATIYFVMRGRYETFFFRNNLWSMADFLEVATITRCWHPVHLGRNISEIQLCRMTEAKFPRGNFL